MPYFILRHRAQSFASSLVVFLLFTPFEDNIWVLDAKKNGRIEKWVPFLLILGHEIVNLSHVLPIFAQKLIILWHLLVPQHPPLNYYQIQLVIQFFPIFDFLPVAPPIMRTFIILWNFDCFAMSGFIYHFLKNLLAQLHIMCASDTAATQIWIILVFRTDGSK